MNVWSVFTWYLEDLNIKINIYRQAILYLYLFSIWSPAICTFLQHSYYCGEPWRSLPRRHFLHPFLFLVGGILGESEPASQLTLHLGPTHQHWECCPRWSRSHRNHHHDYLAQSSNCSLQFFWSPTWLTSLWAADPCEKWHELFYLTHNLPERVSWLAGHSPHGQRYQWWNLLWWDFSDPPLPVSCTSPYDIRLKLRFRQGLVMGDLLDNFLNILKLFLAVASDLIKSLWQRMGGVKERNFNSGLATAK
jgi:hypothetical protein